MPLPVAIYVRISHDPFNQRAGVERQLADCTAIADAKGWGEVVVYEDNDRSALTGRRPEFERLIADLPRLSGVIAWDMDRLVRQPRDLERFLDACDAAKMTRVVTAQGDMDLTKEDTRLHARILGAVAKKESVDKSRRVARAARDRAERGLWNGGPIPYGYRRDAMRPGHLALDDAAAEVVRDVAVAVVEGASLAAVVKRCGGIDGAPKTKPGWRALLLSPTIAGRTAVGEAQWPAIISSQLAADVRSVLGDPKRLTQHTTTRQRWLSGLLVCGECEGWMRWHAREGAKQPRYRCVECRRVTVTAVAIEAFVLGALVAAAPTAEDRQPSPDTPARPAQPELQARLDAVAVAYTLGSITESAWKAASAAAMEAMTLHTNTIEPTITAPPSTIITEDAWRDWTPTERFRAAAWVLRRVIIAPTRVAGRDLTARVEFDWRR
jgi:site-specific DNA recombinase